MHEPMGEVNVLTSGFTWEVRVVELSRDRFTAVRPRPLLGGSTALSSMSIPEGCVIVLAMFAVEGDVNLRPLRSFEDSDCEALVASGTWPCLRMNSGRDADRFTC